MWKKLKTNVLFEHARLKVLEDDVRLPNGKEIKYLKFAKTHDSVTIICQRKDGKILVLSEYSYPTGKWLLEFPGGSTNTGEEDLDAAKRELTEESNYEAREISYIGKYYINNRRSDAIMRVYIARNIFKKNGKKDLEEEFVLEWRSPNEIDSLIASGEIENCHLLASWAIYKQLNLK